MSLVLAIIMRVIDMTDCAKSEKIEDHEGSKFLKNDCGLTTLFKT